MSKRPADHQALDVLVRDLRSPLPADFIVAAYRSLSKFIYDACLRGRFGR